MPNRKNGGSTPNRGEGGVPKVPDNNIVAVARDVQGSGTGKGPGRVDTLSEQGLPNFGVAGEDGAVDANGEFLLGSWVVESELIVCIDGD